MTDKTSDKNKNDNQDSTPVNPLIDTTPTITNLDTKKKPLSKKSFLLIGPPYSGCYNGPPRRLRSRTLIKIVNLLDEGLPGPTSAPAIIEGPKDD